MICIPIKEKNIDFILEKIIKANSLGDIMEIWFDEIQKLDEQDVKKIFNKSSKPIIYKSTTKDLSKIKSILKCKPAFIDLDIKTDKSLIKQIKKLSPKTKIIISIHDFKKTPSTKTLQKYANIMLNNGADIVKIATYAEKIEESLRMLDLLSKLKAKKVKAICLCMGETGKLTRSTGHLFGNFLMYGSLSIKDQTAEGQLTAEDLRKIQNLI
ncbi:MAG: type I 3-dehydroquinate dehydratase [Candidatus Gracilibacteria bacterium]|jgi:3-dehydroquinate dehydratase-1